LIPLADAKKRLSVIISSEEHEGLLETLDILFCKAKPEAIARAKKQVKKGETVSLEIIKKRGDFFIDNFLNSSDRYGPHLWNVLRVEILNYGWSE